MLFRSDEEAELAIERLHITRRHLASGVDVVVLSGVVHNRGEAAHKGVKVEARFVAPDGPDGGAGVAASGWAWSELDALAIAAVADDAAVAALSSAPPKSPTVSPGDRAPFVVVAAGKAAPADAGVVVTAVPVP